jgi:UPF0042 nucleotide-binding protein
MRERTGLDQDVANYVIRQDDTVVFLDKFSDLLNFLLPRYIAEGKSYITVGIGCTGGRHRSPAIAVALSQKVHAANCTIDVRHRDIEL